MGTTAAYAGRWSCQRCTLHNEASSSSCATCGSRNPSATGRPNLRSLDQIRTALPKINFGEMVNAVNSVLANAGVSLPARPAPAQPQKSKPVPPPRPPRPRLSPEHSRPVPSTSAEAMQPSTSSYSKRSPAPGRHSRSNSTQFSFSKSSGELQRSDEEASVREFHRIADFCNSCHIPFLDDGFPQSLKSLGNLSPVESAGAVPCKVDAKDLIWLRPQDMYTKDGRSYCWTVFRDPKSTDIEQGALGNCWFLSALAVIAERPDLLEQIVLTKKYNPTGVYQIRLCVDGEWQVVVVDDFFPCRQRSRMLAFAVGRRNQLWVPLIEKAFAKITGSYAKLLAGRAVEGLAVLTGSPCSLIDIEDADTSEARNIIWASLLSMREANFVMGCSCGAGKRHVDDAAYKAKGLQPRHAYSLLDVAEYGGFRLVRLRNPWGTFVWNGDWSDRWAGWTSHSRSILLPNGPEAGAFWMPFDQFLHHFDSVEVAKVRSGSGWKELRAAFTLHPSWGQHHITAFRLHVQESTEVAVTLHQKGGRDGTDADLMVLVHKLGPSNTVGKLLTRSPRKISAFVATGDVFLNGPEEYLLIPISFSNISDGKNLKLVVAVHSAKPLVAEEIKLPPTAVTDCLIQLAVKEGRKQVSANGVVSRFVGEDFDGHLLMYDNLEERAYLQVHVDCSASMNVISTRSTLKAIDSIPPLHRQIVMMLSHFEATQGYSLYHSMTIRLHHTKELQDWALFAPDIGHSCAPTHEHIPPLNRGPADVLHQPRPIF